MLSNTTFFNLYRHNFVRVAVGIPQVQVADPVFNSRQTIALTQQAAERKALLVVFPELGLSAYSCEDLFQQLALLEGCTKALADIVEASRELPLVTVVGLPLRVNTLLFNCAAVVHRGKILGVVPKSYLPNYREFYELRQFAPADHPSADSLDLCGQQHVPFGNRLLFQLENQRLLSFFVKICEDLWMPIPPSSYAALAGATVLINLSASNVTVGKEDFRRLLVADQSGRSLAAYLYAAAGTGESTTDLAWDGQGMIYENATRLAETKRFAYSPQLITADIDLDRLVQDRMRQSSFGQAMRNHRNDTAAFRTVRLTADLHVGKRLPLERGSERFPFVPSDPNQRNERCRKIYEIQVQGLVKRLCAAGTDKRSALLSLAEIICPWKLRGQPRRPHRDAGCRQHSSNFSAGGRTRGQRRQLRDRGTGGPAFLAQSG